MKDDISQILSKCLSLEGKVLASASQETCEEWDSLKHIQIVVELEDCFNISIPDEDFVLLTSFSKICQYLDEKFGKRQ